MTDCLQRLGACVEGVHGRLAGELDGSGTPRIARTINHESVPYRGELSGCASQAAQACLSLWPQARRPLIKRGFTRLPIKHFPIILPPALAPNRREWFGF